MLPIKREFLFQLPTDLSDFSPAEILLKNRLLPQSELFTAIHTVENISQKVQTFL